MRIKRIKGRFVNRFWNSSALEKYVKTIFSEKWREVFVGQEFKRGLKWFIDISISTEDDEILKP